MEEAADREALVRIYRLNGAEWIRVTTDTRLLGETVAMLRQYIDNETAIAIEAEDSDELLQDVVRLLHMYNLAASRKIHILGCFMLMRQAVCRHRDLALEDNESLTRSILSGDYLFSLYYRLGMKGKEWRLLQHLAPFYKKVQISMFECKAVGPMMRELREELRGYLDKHCA